MRRLKASLLLSVIVVSSFLLVVRTPVVMADHGKAKVYILCLSGVGGCWVNNPSRVKDGIVRALSFIYTGPPWKPTNMPLVHPKYGEKPPFYSISYQVVSDWNTYTNLITSESYKEVIVVNTHGGIIPIPSGYSREDWTAMIAWAMLTRRLSWVHTGGYPFYRAHYQGGSSEEWGETGFQEFMSYINKGNVTCWPPPGVEGAGITNFAEQILGRWKDIYFADGVDIGWPLREEDFKNITIIPIYRHVNYCTGAVTAFAKPGQRFDPSTQYGFGAYVHIGTYQTYDPYGNETDKDFYRGYVGAAAAIWTETQAFPPRIGSRESGSSVSMISVRPAINSYSYYHLPSGPEGWQVRISFGVYGLLKHTGGDSIYDVLMEVNRIPPGCYVAMWTNESREGRGDNLSITGLYTSDNKPVAGTTLYFLGLASLGFAPLKFITLPLGGLKLYSDWLASVVPKQKRGVDTWDSEVSFRYTPYSSRTEKYGYYYDEFESIITIELKVPRSDKNEWRIIPLHWHADLILDKFLGPSISGGITIAIFFDSGDTPTVLYEDFENGMDGWSTYDEYTSLPPGKDYWGLFDYSSYLNFSGWNTRSAWCAWVGNNSIYGVPNRDYWLYDNDMKSHLTRQIDVRPYKEVKLFFEIINYVFSGDYLTVSYYDNGWQSFDPLTTIDGWHFLGPYTISNSTTAIRFTFTSNNDGWVNQGCWLDNIEIRGTLPNDAGTETDAGDSLSDATLIGISDSMRNYAGYLEDDDCYKFPITSSDLGKHIYVGPNFPSGVNFDIELYNPNGTKKQGPTDTIDYQLLSSDQVGNWAIKIYPVSGFGQYDFSMRLIVPGGGCPFLYVWNGQEYVLDNNLLPASEMSSGTDVDDYYRLEQSLSPIHEGEVLSWYSLKIGEFENEHSHLDQVKLLAVDHNSGVKVAVTPEGEILTYKNPHTPVSCIDKHGNDRLETIEAINDERYYQGYADDFLILDFGNINIQNGAKLVIRADEKEWYSIDIQILNSTQNWTTVATMHPRALWATEIVDLSDHLPDANGDLKVRLYFTAKHKLDYVGLDTTPQANITIRHGLLVSAIHSEEGTVTHRLLFNDKVYAELLPNQQITLTFTTAKPTAEKRTFILYTNGHYHTITP